MSTTDRSDSELSPGVKRVRLTVEYDGTHFAGFQLQGKGERTVQGVLEDAFRKRRGPEQSPEAIRVHGSGRTDAGVHALGQVAHCDIAWSVPDDRIEAALNSALPTDVRVRGTHVTGTEFHARYSATERVYRYALRSHPTPSALLRNYVWQLPKSLDIESMREAAGALVGIHDFASFGQPDAPGKSTIRFVRRLDVRRAKSLRIPGVWIVTVAGNAFLRSQVRAFVGTLVAVGEGRIEPADVGEILLARNRALCPSLAPAQGLYLAKVRYDGIRYDDLLRHSSE